MTVLAWLVAIFGIVALLVIFESMVVHRTDSAKDRLALVTRFEVALRTQLEQFRIMYLEQSTAYADDARATNDQHRMLVNDVIANQLELMRVLVALAQNPTAISGLAQLERFKQVAGTAPNQLQHFLAGIKDTVPDDPDLYGVGNSANEPRMPVGL